MPTIGFMFLTLCFAFYLLWLVAGLGDFLCHRASDLPQTSGVAESTTHLLQLAMLAVAIIAGMALEMHAGVALLLLVLVTAHAIVGYVDTRIAFARKRVSLPIEQHLHSVLDMAPWIALGVLVATTWPAAVDGAFAFAPRSPALPIAWWIAVLLPPLALCLVPALLEFRASLACARAGSRPRPSR